MHKRSDVLSSYFDWISGSGADLADTLMGESAPEVPAAMREYPRASGIGGAIVGAPIAATMAPAVLKTTGSAAKSLGDIIAQLYKGTKTVGGDLASVAGQVTKKKPGLLRKKGHDMDLLEDIRSEATGVTRTRKVAGVGFDLDSIVTKVAEGDDKGEEGADTAGGFGGEGAEGGSEGQVEGSGEVPGADTPELPPELQQLLMILMQHPELIQQLLHGGQPGGEAAGMGGAPEAEHDQMAQALMAGGGGGAAPGAEAGGAPPMGM